MIDYYHKLYTDNLKFTVTGGKALSYALGGVNGKDVEYYETPGDVKTKKTKEEGAFLKELKDALEPKGSQLKIEGLSCEPKYKKGKRKVDLTISKTRIHEYIYTCFCILHSLLTISHEQEYWQREINIFVVMVSLLTVRMETLMICTRTSPARRIMWVQERW